MLGGRKKTAEDDGDREEKLGPSIVGHTLIIHQAFGSVRISIIIMLSLSLSPRRHVSRRTKRVHTRAQSRAWREVRKIELTYVIVVATKSGCNTANPY